VLLSQGMGEAAEAAAGRRVDTLAMLCRLGHAQLSELSSQRAAALQRAAEQVALTRARLFSVRTVGPPRPRRPERVVVREDLLRVALELRRFAVFRQFSDAQLVELARIGRKETFRHAQVIVREALGDRDFFVVLDGRLQASRHTPVGEQSIGAATTGDVFGEIAFLDQKPRSATVAGIEEGTVLRLPTDDVEHIVARDQEFGVALLWSFWHSLAAKVRGANATMTELITPMGGTGPRVAGRPGRPVHLDPGVKLELLKQQGLSAGELRLLATYSHEESFAAEAPIFGEGEHGDKLYIVVDGQVRISRSLPGMGEEALTILGRGEVFGEMALIDSQPRSADARAHIAGCTVFTIDRQRLEEVLDMDPDAARQFLTLLCQLLCRRIRAMNDRLVAWRLMAGHE
jgi:CRP/FNR family cyclic AMP-dependent transcriptional regulator